MIPWDYNLAFGGFQSADATATVNEPIDSPVSGSSTDDRPMAAWIFADETYTALYHRYFAEFLNTTDFTALIEESYALIAPYVEKDPTKFCTYEEFEAGVDALKTFCTLRAESVAGQLAGTIPSTSEGQSADRSNLVDAGECSIAAMGTMGNVGSFQKIPLRPKKLRKTTSRRGRTVPTKVRKAMLRPCRIKTHGCNPGISLRKPLPPAMGTTGSGC